MNGGLARAADDSVTADPAGATESVPCAPEGEALAACAATYHAQAEEALAAEDPELAVLLLGQAVEAVPGDVGARLELSRTLLTLAKPDEAREQIEAALRIDPLHGEANYLEGRVLEQSGQERLAIGYYRAAANADAGDLRARTRLAMLLMRQGDFGNAERRLREVLEAQPLSADSHYHLGLVSIARGKCGEGIEAFESAARLGPHDPRVQEALSRAYATCPDATEAQKRRSLRSAGRLHRRFPGRHTSATLAMAMAANGRFEDAVEVQTQAIFEAIQAEDVQAQRDMYLDLQRYKNGEPAARAWPEGSTVFAPPLARAWPESGGDAEVAAVQD